MTVNMTNCPTGDAFARRMAQAQERGDRKRWLWLSTLRYSHIRHDHLQQPPQPQQAALFAEARGTA